MNERIKVNFPELICPYCKDEIGIGVGSVSCGCHAVHHSSCVEEFGNSNTCGSCNYVFNSPEAVQLGDEHFKKPESLEEMVEESVEANDETNLGNHTKALAYIAKDVVFGAVKGVSTLVYYSALCTVASPYLWYKTHFSVVKKEEGESVHWKKILKYAVGAGVFTALMLFSYDFLNVPEEMRKSDILWNIYFGFVGGFVGGGMQQAGGLNKSIHNSIKSKYASYLEKIKNK